MTDENCNIKFPVKWHEMQKTTSKLDDLVLCSIFFGCLALRSLGNGVSCL